MMKPNNIFFFGLLFLFFQLTFFSSSAQSKLEIGSVIQENKITDFNHQKLILIDFWATWCVPCIPAARQLEVYQEQLWNDVYMIGISDENEHKIKRFIAKEDFKLAIYQDHNFSNITRFNVPYRPYSVILNGKGEVIWQGSPWELSASKLKNFAEIERWTEYSLDDVFRFMENKPVLRQFTEVDTMEIYAKKHADHLYDNQLVQTNSRVYYEGDLIGLYSLLMDLPKNNFETTLDFKLTFGASATIWANDKVRIIEFLNKQFGLSLKRQTKLVAGKELKIVDSSLLWDADQIDWGKESIQNYIVGDQRIDADNLSIKEICALLTDLKNEPFIYQGKDHSARDWSFHYNYDNLMEEELLYQFGIQVIPASAAPVEYIEIKNSNS